MVCADTNAFILSLVCLINLALALFFFTPFRCTPCYALHDFLGSKIFAVLSFDLALFISALIYTAAPDSWPGDFTSQLWIIISFWVFFYFIFDVLWVLIFPLSALSLMSPVWVVIKDIIKSKWKYAFGVNASDDLVLATFVVLLAFLGFLSLLLFYYRFLHRLYYSVVLSLLMVIAIKTLLNNVGIGKICCEFGEDANYDECPILLSTTYFIIYLVLAVGGIWVTMFKYQMLCYSGDRKTTKSQQDKVNSGEAHESFHNTHVQDTDEPYTRIDQETPTSATIELQSLMDPSTVSSNYTKHD